MVSLRLIWRGKRLKIYGVYHLIRNNRLLFRTGGKRGGGTKKDEIAATLNRKTDSVM